MRWKPGIITRATRWYLEIADGDGRHSIRLGPDLAAGELPQAMVPPHAWQAAESCGDWTLVGCTVAPGFDFAKFELAPKGLAAF